VGLVNAMTARKRLPNRRGHEVIAFEHDGQKYIAGVGRFDPGSLGKVLLIASKSGTAIQNFAADSAILLSFVLQHGADPAAIRRVLVQRSWRTGQPDRSAAGSSGRKRG
jgi:hypothetical protein